MSAKRAADLLAHGVQTSRDILTGEGPLDALLRTSRNVLDMFFSALGLEPATDLDVALCTITITMWTTLVRFEELPLLFAITFRSSLSRSLSLSLSLSRSCCLSTPRPFIFSTRVLYFLHPW
jgi:hypothetical protein